MTLMISMGAIRTSRLHSWRSLGLLLRTGELRPDRSFVERIPLRTQKMKRGSSRETQIGKASLEVDAQGR